MKRFKLVMRTCVFALLCAGLLVSCRHSSEPTISSQGNPGTQTARPTKTIGDTFLSSNLKIKSTITDFGVSPEREITVELYVDAFGNGEGMLGFGDVVCDVYVVKDVLYVVVDKDIVISVNDITGRLTASADSLVGQDDLTVVGFKVVNGVPIEYNAKLGNLNVTTSFAQSTNTFEAASLATDNVMSFEEATHYIVQYNEDKAGTVDEPDADKDVESFYLQSKYGVEIDGGLYSVGDTCNPRTYFGGRTPEGILTSTKYKQDEKVDFLHVSYITDTGRSSIILTSNYVQAIETAAQFSWLGLEKGLDSKELKSLLGYKLSKKELEVWEPIDPELEVIDFKRNTYYCTVGALSVELRCTSNGLDSIYIERPLDYVPK